VYLLDIVLPSVPSQTLRTYYSRTIPCLIKLLDTLSSQSGVNSEGTAAIIKSTIGVLETLIKTQEYHAWKSGEETGVQQIFSQYILAVGIDPRPKIRKRALEAIKQILSNPPTHPSTLHPVGETTAMIAFHTVQTQFGPSSKKKKTSERDSKAVHSLQLLKVVASCVSWPKSNMRELVELVLKLSSETYDDIIRLAALEVFQVIFSQATDELNRERLSEILNVVPLQVF
jgi:ribosomal RNA-processing protein 12